jgi:hypothetical protein
MAPLVAQHGVRLYSITVGEKSTQCATYFENDSGELFVDA